MAKVENMTSLKILSIALSAVFSIGCAAPQSAYVPVQPSQTFTDKSFVECRQAYLERMQFTNYLSPRLQACLDRNDQQACKESDEFLKNFLDQRFQDVDAHMNYFPKEDKVALCIGAENFGGFSFHEIEEIVDEGATIISLLVKFDKKYMPIPSPERM
jgi:hypothetical protein